MTDPLQFVARVCRALTQHMCYLRLVAYFSHNLNSQIKVKGITGSEIHLRGSGEQGKVRCLV